MSDTDLRFFLAHDKDTPDDLIDTWVKTLTTALEEAYEGQEVTVVAGRDDYNRRAKAAGGWKGCSRSIVNGTLWDKSPLFHGIIRPCFFLTGPALVGRATSDMITGFLDSKKTAWAWDTEEDVIGNVIACNLLSNDSWKQYATLVVEQPDD